ncbi:MAG: hypothetical protein QOI41_1674 [Myxococcales bacterium]|nr:hypothetical protein [Myxococcales bacterium]
MVDVTDPPAEIAPAPAPAAPVPAPAATPAPARVPTPSLVTAAPLGANTYGMTLGGGYTAILPLFLLEVGYGVSRRVDLAFRYETVSGLFHYPQLAVRWAFADLGPWTLAARLGANYSLFAVRSDQTNLTSTFYLSGELTASRPVTPSTDFIAAVRTDFDLFEFRIVDGTKHATGTYRFDAMIFRLGARTQATDDLSVYLLGSLRVPTESFTYRAEQFYVLPTVEVGGTFVW